ncbi:MAG: poly(3-hydroxyalkanoate) depolymerase [Pseudomonadota bacterium]|nr:poly(3-hydroxyalkanoate) depolymerase [Pseudomonadota bacterium]
MRLRRVKVMGYSLRVAIWPGRADTHTPLVLFNGIGARLELLEPFADELGDLETIAIDVPGTGKSSLPLHPYRLWMLSLLIERALTRLGYDQVDVLGVSWGGTLAQQFALQNPRRCRRLILAATAQGWPMVVDPRILLKFMTPRRYNDPVYRRAIAGEIYGGAARHQAGLIREIGPRMMPTSKLGYLMQQFALSGWTSTPWLPLIRQPVLIMAGNDDPVIPLINARIMAKLIRHCRLHVVNDGHLFLVSDPVGSSRVVREFLDATHSKAIAAA